MQKISSHSISDKIEKAIDPAGDLKKAINEPVDDAKAALSEPQPEAEPAKPSIADMTATMPSLTVTPVAVAFEAGAPAVGFLLDHPVAAQRALAQATDWISLPTTHSGVVASSI